MKYLNNMRTIMLTIVLAFPFYVNAQFKIVGYIRPGVNMLNDINKVDLKKVTHLNIAFINPDTAGNFKDIPALNNVVQIAHQHNVKVLMSCGGGSRQAYYSKLLSDSKRDKVVKNFIDFVNKYDLDGIDVDLEGDDIDENYENFVVALKKPLAENRKLLTAALAFYTRKRVSDIALQQFDFINMMAYDKTGPWRPSDPTHHSPMSYAVDHLNYWKKERGISKDKLIIGVPFYGYGFGSLPEADKTFQTMFYSEIIKRFPGSENKDEISLPNNGGTVYYNGIITIKEKTKFALEQGGGVMIWQLLHDTNDDKSLLKAINEVSNFK